MLELIAVVVLITMWGCTLWFYESELADLERDLHQLTRAVTKMADATVVAVDTTIKRYPPQWGIIEGPGPKEFIPVAELDDPIPFNLIDGRGWS